MAFRSCVGVVLFSCLVVLAASAGPKPKGRKPVNPPTRTIADNERKAEAEAEITNDCPEDGFFADAEQCDKYYECRIK
ncbi:hypothetical protein B5X24_HaOG206887 [Helicoverpa armigera]|uniref:Uncharacterized protein n=1 Tax=Helicoverpa armigera TaxID=29058 RepID=A0A2W1BMW0_HELAM|nr:hypothetical protein B5X24_HaOG206887 [Helicoverpa armigera]